MSKLIINKKDLVIKFELKDTIQPYRVYYKNIILWFAKTQNEAEDYISNFEGEKNEIKY